MAARGYGNKTFQIETDAQGVPIVHRVNGDYSDSHYKSRGRPGNEINRAFDTSSIVQLIVMDISRSSGGIGVGIKQRGMGIVYGGWSRSTATHELGHAFGLQHDFRDDAYIMSYGFNRDSLSPCAARFLAVSPYFNPNVPFAAGSPPGVELASSSDYAHGETTVPVQFRVHDPDGLQQVILFVKTPEGLGPLSPAGFMELKACRELDGQTDVTVQFDYDGNTPSHAGSSLLNPLRHTVYVSTVDRDGNRIDSPVPVSLRATNIQQASVPVGERSLRVRESVFEVVRRFYDRSVSSYEHVTDAHLAEISTLFVNNIHASDSPLQSNDFDGLTGLSRLELRLDSGFSEESLLPSGIFEGLTSLGSLQFKYKPGVYGDEPALFPLLPLPVGLKKVGEGRFKAVVHTGAPFDVDLRLHVVNGRIDGGATAITVPTGSVESALLTVTRTPGTTAAVIVDIEELPGLPESHYQRSQSADGIWTRGHPGYTLYRSSFPLEMFSPLAGAPAPVTERTPQVIDAIVSAVPELNAALHDRERRYVVDGRFRDEIYNMGNYVSEAHLAAITSLDVSGGSNLDLGGNWFSRNGDVTELKPGDFDGLSNLAELRLDDNQLRALPANVFDKLSNLKELFLDGNRLSALPANVFDELTNLTKLFLSNNRLSSLPEDIFDPLTDLKILAINTNKLSSLQSGVFDQLTNLTRLYLNSNQLSSLPENTFDQLTKLTLLNLFDNPLSSVRKSDFDHLTHLEVLLLPGGSTSNPLPEFSGDTPVTERTPRVRDAIVAAADADSAGEVTETHLAAIKLLDLSGQDIAGLKAGDFDNLTSLEGLDLGENQLSTLPEGLFEFLINLKAIDLGGNQLSSLPEDLFDDLTSLKVILLNDNQLSSLPTGLFNSPANLLAVDLSDNQLSSIPEGMFGRVTLSLFLDDNQLSSLPDGIFRGIFNEIPDFTGLTALGNPLGPIPVDTYRDLPNPTTLDLRNNPGAPFSVIVSLKKVGDGQFKGIAPTGAPLEITLPLTVDNGNVSGGATTITIPAGGVESDTLTVTRVPGTTFAVTANIGDLPGMPAKHRGYSLVRSADLPLIFTEFGGRISVCQRTPQVRDVIVDAAPVNDCSAVTEGHLAAITRLSPVSDRISVLQRGDFSGLTNLTRLNLNDNQLSSLPADLFDNLTNLTRLSLNSNQLSSLPADLFDNLANLTRLEMNRNRLRSLPAGVFDDLTSLTALDLRVNQLSSLPADLFDNLINLVGLYLNTNELSSLPAGLFDNLTNLGELDLSRNELSSLPGGVFDHLANQAGIDVSQNRLKSLPAGLFGNLTLSVDLSGNQLSSMPSGLFANLTELNHLSMDDNLISPLPLTVTLAKHRNDQFKAVAPTGAPFELVLPVTVSGPGAIAGNATTITISTGSVESAPLTLTRTPGTSDAVTVDIGTLPGLARNHSGYSLVKPADLPLAYYIGAEGRSGETPGGQATTDFNGDGRTDFADFFLFADAFGGTDAKFDLDGSGTVDFADFFKFVDAFGS